MSIWSYIKGYIQVEPMGRTQEEKEYILKTVLNHLPVVQGSEEDMYVHIIKAAGHDTSCSGDEFGYCTNNLKVDGYGVPYKSRHGWRRLQSTYYLFIEAHLRDRDFDWTYRQFVKWLTRLAKRIRVSYVDIAIDESWRAKATRIEGCEFEDIYETPTWAQWKDFKYIKPYDGYNINWCEYLMYNDKE